MDFLSAYTSQRKSLRVVFHLIDCRHGATEDDARIMNQMSRNLPRSATYVIVLTKADKTSKGSTTVATLAMNSPSNNNNYSVSRQILDQVRTTMIKEGVGTAPIILTSAETKLGRDALWSYMRLAADRYEQM